jgi:DNA polymerase (family 10)
VVGEIAFLIESDNFPAVVSKLQSYGGRADLLNSAESTAVFKLAPGILLRIDMASRNKWGVALILSTGSENHLKKLQEATFDLKELLSSKDSYPDESAVYRKLGMSFIEPELREGHDEVELARRGALPVLVSAKDIRGELHAHTVSSDGANTIEQMAAAARAKNYEYIGISDHSQSLKIAGGLSEDDLWQQIRYIDKLNEKTGSIRILKSAEVDILVDGTLDYSNELLRELDYTVCSIHSRFGISKADQTNRILRAMENPYFTILGHATGRLLLKRPGYEIEIERVVEHAKATGCFFEINSSPDRLDLSAANARLARQAGVKIAVCTDAHSTRELDHINLGVDQARRAGLERSSILNCLSWPELRGVLKR